MNGFQVLFHKWFSISIVQRIQPVMEELLFVADAYKELDCLGFHCEF